MPPWKGKKGGVHIVHTLGVGLGRIGAELGRFGEVFGRGQCLQGAKVGSSPTSGTRFPLSEAVSLSDCAQTGSDGEQGVPVSVGGLQSSCGGRPPFSPEALGGLSYYFMGEYCSGYMTFGRDFHRVFDLSPF